MALATWMLAESPTIEELALPVDDHRMYYLRAGNGPALILLHGLLGSAEAWYPCIPKLAENSTVYAPDALGIGKSERVPDLDASLTAHVDRVEKFLRKAGIEKADFVGTSHGGAVAMMMAARYPHRVRSLLLHAPANPFSTASDPLVHFYRSPLGHWFAQQVPYLPEKLQELALGRMYGNSQLVRHDVLQRYMNSLRVPGTVQHVMNMIDGWFENMKTLAAALDGMQKVPALLLWGTRDRAVTLESGRVLEKKLGAEMVILPGVGHLPHDEAPLTFADAINEFLHKLNRCGQPSGPKLVQRY
ncbi:alpha/beta fold hydrolase [Acidobacterium sp. S8]|uniref:alpha/beta fold hydrolase n=1 Tax=Acidobacterium sp. S8 TaxID=1641854 RepID=UPI00131AB94F|nr:alpha/beta hydrolase [Acidobacterium sp. S8]